MADDFNFNSGDGGARTAPGHIAARGKGRSPVPPMDLQRTLSIPPWDVEMPPTGQNFWTFTQAMLSLAAVAGAQANTTVLTGGFFQIPTANVGALKAVVFSISNPALVDQFRFTVRANGVGLAGLTNVGFQPVVASYFALPIAGSWQLQKGAVLDVLFTNLAGTGPLSVGITLTGWHVSEADVFAYTGQRPFSIESVGNNLKSLLPR